MTVPSQFLKTDWKKVLLFSFTAKKKKLDNNKTWRDVSGAPGGQALVDHLQQRWVLQSCCHSLFVRQLFVHCTYEHKKTTICTMISLRKQNMNFKGPKMEDVIMSAACTCVLWGMSPRSDANIYLDRKEEKTNDWENNNNIHLLKDMTLRVYPSFGKKDTNILWTSRAGSAAAWLWLTVRWGLPCCSEVWWV